MNRFRSRLIVTAQKRQERLLDVPMSISAITGKMMTDSGATQLADFLQTVPGVGILDSQNGLQNIEIRGINSTFGNAPIGYYLDEMPFTFIGNTPVPDVRTYDLERVEVLRGPQGTLYGDGSLGGTIRILTKDPDVSQFETSVDLTGENTKGGADSNAEKAMLNLPLKDGVLAVRLVGSREDYGGWVHDTVANVKDENERQIDNYRGKINYAPSDNVDVVLSAWHTKEDAIGSNASTEDGTVPYTPSDSVTTYDIYSATVRAKFSAFDLVSATSRMLYNLSSAATILNEPSLLLEHINLITEELHLTSNSTGIFRWTAGVFYRHLQQTTSDVIEAYAFDETGTARSNSFAAFSEGTWSLLDRKLDVTLGLRYFQDNQVTMEPVSPAILALVRLYDPNFTPTASPTFHNVDPRLNLSYHLSKDWLVYTNIAKGFRSGLTQPVTSLIPAIVNGINNLPISIDPETLWSYEVGTKSSLANGRVTLEGSAYFNNWSNLQNFVVVDPVFGLGGLINGGRAHTKGVELAVGVLPVEGLVLNLTGSLVDAIFVQNVAGTPIQTGDRVPEVPKTNLTAAATYRWPFTASLGGFAHADVQYNSPRNNIITASLASDPITMVGMRLGVEGKSWGAVDVKYLGPDGAAARLQPRTIGLEVRAGL